MYTLYRDKFQNSSDRAFVPSLISTDYNNSCISFSSFFICHFSSTLYLIILFLVLFFVYFSNPFCFTVSAIFCFSSFFLRALFSTFLLENVTTRRARASA